MEFELRPWNDKDLDELVKHANNPKIAANLTNGFPYPYTIENGRRFIDFTKQNDPALILAITHEQKPIGSIGLHPLADIYAKNAELGYWLAEEFWGKGIMTEAILQMIDYGFQHLDINRIFARPFGTNKASQRVLEKTGFILEARFDETIFKNGEYLDELVYGIRKNPEYSV